MNETIKQVKDNSPELSILKINHDIDYIQLLRAISPKMSFSQEVKILKYNNSRDLKKKLSFLTEGYCGLMKYGLMAILSKEIR